ncbi:defense protein 3-like [Epargyreus clarus]|uniref:defense protein 3-like n=1 Tax=Epargyreus clarus TaxID=520877 RepID=UPI003C2BFFA3
MFAKGFVLAVLLVGVNCRYLLVEEHPMHLAEDGVILGEDGTVYFSAPLETVQMEPLSRARRQAQTTISVDGKTGNTEFGAKIPVARSDNNILSVTGTQSAASRGLGLALDNVNGHGLSVSQRTIPEFGKQLTAAGKLNVLDTDKHNLNANAFVTKNMPTQFPGAPNFNTYGGGVDYTFNDKVGASLNAARTDLFKRTDVSALGHLNLFKNKDTSFDFNAGASRSFSPFIPKSSWEPTYGFSLTKFW